VANTALDFFSLGALQASLAELRRRPGSPRRGREDMVLDHARATNDVRNMATRRRRSRAVEGASPGHRKVSPAALPSWR